MSYDTLLLARDGAVATITLNRPAVLNALNRQTVDELRRAVLEVRHDDGRARAGGDRGRRQGVRRGRRHQGTRGGDAARRSRTRAARPARLRPHRAASGSPASPPSTGSPWAAAANWRCPARSASPPTPRGWGCRKRASGIIPGYGGTQRSAAPGGARPGAGPDPHGPDGVRGRGADHRAGDAGGARGVAGRRGAAVLADAGVAAAHRGAARDGRRQPRASRWASPTRVRSRRRCSGS